MDATNHPLQELFAQLGLPNDATAIESFVKKNQLPAEISLENAPFWNVGQAQFIREPLSEDADWAEVVDHLNTMLRR